MSAEKERAGGAGRSPAIGIPSIGETALRALAWDSCGIVRSGEGLTEARRYLEDCTFQTEQAPELASFELRNIHAVALLIARCALAREESRGAHFRTDFPSPRVEFEKHSLIAGGRDPSFRAKIEFQ